MGGATNGGTVGSTANVKGAMSLDNSENTGLKSCPFEENNQH